MKYIGLSLLAILFMACQPEKAPVEYEKPDVALNNGDRWVANHATIEGIAKMESLVETFSGDDYSALQENLRSEFQEIFKKCTMKGEAHEELHAYLFPLMELFGALTEGSEDDREQVLNELKWYLGEFDSYFRAEA